MPAYAHAELVSTIPADGQRLETAPSEAVLRFTEQVRLIPGAVRLLDAGGRPVSTEPARVDGSTVILPLPANLPTGGYVISWRVISSDTHPVAGAFGFGVHADAPRAEAPARTVQEATPSVRAAVTIGRWTGYAGLALLLGGVVFLLLCWPTGRVLRRARRLVAAGWVLAVAATVIGLLVQGPYVAGVGWSGLGARMLGQTVLSPFGVLHVIRLALLVLVGLLARRVLRSSPPARFSLAVGAVLAAALVVTYSMAGHAAAGRWPAAAITSDALHLTAMSLWVGGLVLLAACALPPRHAEGLGEAARRFSRLATGAVAVLVVTGTWQALREVGSVAALTGSGYGRLLLIKLAIVAAVVGLGGVSMFAVRRVRNTAAWLRRSVPVEIVLVAVILAVTAVLVVTPPGRPARAGADAEPGWAQVDLRVPDGTWVHLRVTPAAVGMNEVSVTVSDAAGKPRFVRQVTAGATLPERELGPFDVHLTGGGNAFAGHVTFPLPGAWRFDITVHLSDLDAYVVSAPIRVQDEPR